MKPWLPGTSHAGRRQTRSIQPGIRPTLFPPANRLPVGTNRNKRRRGSSPDPRGGARRSWLVPPAWTSSIPVAADVVAPAGFKSIRDAAVASPQGGMSQAPKITQPTCLTPHRCHKPRTNPPRFVQIDPGCSRRTPQRRVCDVTRNTRCRPVVRHTPLSRATSPYRADADQTKRPLYRRVARLARRSLHPLNPVPYAPGDQNLSAAGFRLTPIAAVPFQATQSLVPSLARPTCLPQIPLIQRLGEEAGLKFCQPSSRSYSNDISRCPATVSL